MSELQEINDKLTKLTVHAENIKEDISEMKGEREKHKDVFWNNMNSMKEDLQKEREDRIAGDSSINTDLRVMKAKVSAWASMVAIGINLAMYWVRSKLTS